MKNKFGPSSIVFDGCNAGPSIEDHEHQKRAAQTSANIQIDDALQVAVHKEAFLSNERNKDQFVKMLRSSLEPDGHSVIQSQSNADTNIVSETLRLATQGNSVTVASAGSQIFVKMYGGKPSNNLDYLRYIKNVEYAATLTKTLQPKRHPPTERAGVGK